VLVGGKAGTWLDGALTIVWVVGITASFSILDHMDGLCAGVAAMASAFFALLAYLNGQTVVTTLAAATLGAAAGFLRWNFKPAKIFMGDGGAMFLGFLMATLGLKLRLAQSSNLAGWLAPVLILGATIFDTTLVTISRSRRGLLPFATPGKDHSAHRLANLGLGQRGAVVAMYLGGAIGGCAAVVAAYSSTLGAAIVGLLAIAVVVLAVLWLERAPYERQTRKSPA
jgi:UDP-GlcNAc:undecaprenyl-phosphate GlcNAc-1-phosphate transferase